VLTLLVLKNGPDNFSQLFCSCRICVKSSFLNFKSNDIWWNAFFWNKVVCDDSTFPTNGTRSEKVGNTYTMKKSDDSTPLEPRLMIFH